MDGGITGMQSALAPRRGAVRTATRAALVAVALSTAGGCVWLSGYDAEGRLVPKTFTVDLSGLDWVEISYMPEPGDPVFAMACRLSLLGSGEVVFRTGRSPQVWNSFSSQIEDPHWNELFEDRMHLEREEMQALYQELVDAGLFPKRKPLGRPEDVSTPFVKVNAKIGQERALRIVNDRRIVRIVERVLTSFEEAALQARASAEAP